MGDGFWVLLWHQPRMGVPNGFPKGSPKNVPKDSPRGPQRVFLKGAQRVSPGYPQRVPKGSPQSIPKGAPRVSPRCSQRFPMGSPESIPRVLPKGVHPKVPKECSQRVLQGATKECSQDVPKGSPEDVLKMLPKDPQGVPIGSPSDHKGPPRCPIYAVPSLGFLPNRCPPASITACEAKGKIILPKNNN